MAFLGSFGRALGRLGRGVARGVGRVARTLVKAAPAILPAVLPGPWGWIAGAALGGTSGAGGGAYMPQWNIPWTTPPFVPGGMGGGSFWGMLPYMWQSQQDLNRFLGSVGSIGRTGFGLIEQGAGMVQAPFLDYQRFVGGQYLPFYQQFTATPSQTMEEVASWVTGARV